MIHVRLVPCSSLHCICVRFAARTVCFVWAVILLAVGRCWPPDGPLLVCYGDSITAGYGLQDGQSFPDALQRDLNARGYHYKVINQGTSGATTKDAVAGLRSILELHPAVVIVEFGGNDGLRGLPLTETRRNLDAVLTALETAHIKILLAGITLPPNYGREYIHALRADLPRAGGKSTTSPSCP